MKSPKYQIGEVLYCVARDAKQRTLIVPVRVSEVHTSETSDGVRVYYKVTNEHGKVSSLSDEADGVYKDPEDLSAFLLDRSKQRIDKMVEKAVSIASKWDFEAVASKSVPQSLDIEHSSDSEDDDAIVELPDGRVARLKTS